MIKRSALVTVMFAALLAAGCTWVALSPQAKQKGVMVLPQARVAGCRLLGKTEVSVAYKIGFVERASEDVEHDLENLAMNQAAAAGGDTVSPLSAVEKGNQTFGIYRCLGAGASAAAPAPPAATAVKTIPYQPPR